MPGDRSGPELDFFGHLDALRRRILAAILIFLIASIAVFSMMDGFMPLLVSPAERMGLRLYAMSPVEKLAAYMKASALAGATLALPLAAALAASFVAPGLGPRARGFLAPFLILVCLFVLAGVALAWLVLVPFAIGFFARFASGDGIEPLWSLGSYISLVSGLVAATAIVCLLPPLLLAAIRSGILDPAALAKRRRHAIVAIAVIAALVTPTIDVVSQLTVGAAMWALFEITILIGRVIAPRRGRGSSGVKSEVLDG